MKYLRALGKGKRYEVDRLTVQENNCVLGTRRSRSQRFKNKKKESSSLTSAGAEIRKQEGLINKAENF